MYAGARTFRGGHINRFKLPLQKRYIFHKRIGISLHRKAWLIAAALVLGLLIAAGEEYMLEHDMRLTRENEVRDLVAHSLRPPLGAPGTVASDWREDTVNLKVRKP